MKYSYEFRQSSKGETIYKPYPWGKEYLVGEQDIKDINKLNAYLWPTAGLGLVLSIASNRLPHTVRLWFLGIMLLLALATIGIYMLLNARLTKRFIPSPYPRYTFLQQRRDYAKVTHIITILGLTVIALLMDAGLVALMLRVGLATSVIFWLFVLMFGGMTAIVFINLYSKIKILIDK